MNEILNKTDAMMRMPGPAGRVGFYEAVQVKSFDSVLTRTLVGNQLLSISTQLGNQIRSLMETFGLIHPKGTGRVVASF